MTQAFLYRVFETAQFDKDLRHTTHAGHADVVEKLRRTVYAQLRRHPHFGTHIRKLKSFTPETWRYRIGAWRFFYEIDEEEQIVLMIAAAHRGSPY